MAKIRFIHEACRKCGTQEKKIFSCAIEIFTRQPYFCKWICLLFDFFIIIHMWNLYLIKFYNFVRIHIFNCQKNIADFNQIAMCVKKICFFKLQKFCRKCLFLQFDQHFFYRVFFEIKVFSFMEMFHIRL